jgi:hypothetical protein
MARSRSPSCCRLTTLANPIAPILRWYDRQPSAAVLSFVAVYVSSGHSAARVRALLALWQRCCTKNKEAKKGINQAHTPHATATGCSPRSKPQPALLQVQKDAVHQGLRCRFDQRQRWPRCCCRVLVPRERDASAAQAQACVGEVRRVRLEN